ncbi:MAG: hypothetical protein V4632_24035 [Pseudomonadota bacterium]
MTKRKIVQPDLIDLLHADYKKPEDLIGAGYYGQSRDKERAGSSPLTLHTEITLPQTSNASSIQGLMERQNSLSPSIWQ